MYICNYKYVNKCNYVVRMTLLLWVIIIARAYNYIRLTLYIEIAEV